MRHLLPQGLPRGFWVLFWGRLFNSIGTSLVFPFLTIYLHEKLSVSLTVVGVILLLQGVAQAAAVLFGGLLADRWGRRPTLLLSLVAGGVLTVLLGVAQSPWLIVASVALRGMAFPLFGPASQAMIADMVPKARLLESFGLTRVAANTGIIIGPILGTFLVTRSFTLLFVLSGAVMIVFASALLFLLKVDTRPRTAAPEPLSLESLVSLDRSLLLFTTVTALTSVVYSQLYWVLPGYLVVSLHQAKVLFGYLAAENALFVVLLQVPTSRLAERLPGERAMALGVLFYALGFGLMAFWHQAWPFGLSILAITVGENMVNPAATTWAATHSTEARRGRTLSLQTLANRLGSGIGPLFGGAALDVGGALALWGSVAGLALVSSVLYGSLGRLPGALPPRR